MRPTPGWWSVSEWKTTLDLLHRPWNHLGNGAHASSIVAGGKNNFLQFWKKILAGKLYFKNTKFAAERLPFFMGKCNSKLDFWAPIIFFWKFAAVGKLQLLALRPNICNPQCCWHFCLFTFLIGALSLFCAQIGGLNFSCYLRQGGYIFARLCLFVCLFVCLCVSKITQKVMDGSFWNFLGMSGMAKLPVVQFWAWSCRNPGFWITLKFSLPLR